MAGPATEQPCLLAQDIIHEALALLNYDPFCFLHDFAALQAHFEPASETEGASKDLDEDPDKLDQDYPPADPLGTHMIQEGARPMSALVQDAQPQESHQQDLSFLLDKLRQETNRSAWVGQ